MSSTRQSSGSDDFNPKDITKTVGQHDEDIAYVKKHLADLEIISDGDRMLTTIKKDSRIQEQLEEWIWGVIKKKAWQAFFYVLFAVLILSLVNFGLDKLWGAIWSAIH